MPAGRVAKRDDFSSRTGDIGRDERGPGEPTRRRATVNSVKFRSESEIFRRPVSVAAVLLQQRFEPAGISFAETKSGDLLSHIEVTMNPLPHHYAVHLTGGPSGYAQVSTPGVPGLRTAPPADYDGPGDAWSPEHLLLASIQTCFLFTFRAIARVSRLEFLSLEIDATGIVDRREGVTRFTEVVLRPVVTVPAGSDHERVLHALEKTEKNCLVSASLSTLIRLEPEISEARALVGC
jgi:uncharacterized OsmC-like protein